MSDPPHACSAAVPGAATTRRLHPNLGNVRWPLPGYRNVHARSPAVNAELLVIADCPNEGPAAEFFRGVLDAMGYLDEIRISVIRTNEEAARRGFRGSPTFLVNGDDLFLPAGLEPAIACRVYPTRTGLKGLPASGELMTAVTRMVAHASVDCQRADSARRGMSAR